MASESDVLDLPITHRGTAYHAHVYYTARGYDSEMCSSVPRVEVWTFFQRSEQTMVAKDVMNRSFQIRIERLAFGRFCSLLDRDMIKVSIGVPFSRDMIRCPPYTLSLSPSLPPSLPSMF